MESSSRLQGSSFATAARSGDDKLDYLVIVAHTRLGRVGFFSETNYGL